MKLLTLNCHSWQEEKQMEKLHILAMTIHEHSYDVVALQEVNQSITSNKLSGDIREDNFAELLVQELHKLGATDYQYIWGFSHIAYDHYEEGVALLTKHPLLKKQSFFVSKSNDTSFWKARKVVQLTIDFHGWPVSFLSCHFGWWHDEEEPFRRQFDQLMTHLNKSMLHFLMGDFNNEAGMEQEGYEYTLDSGFYDTYQLAKQKDAGITVKGSIAGWDENIQDKRIDFIFASRKIDVLSSTVIFNGENRDVISDHFGIEVIINNV